MIFWVQSKMNEYIYNIKMKLDLSDNIIDELHSKVLFFWV